MPEILRIKVSERLRYPGYRTRSAWVRSGGEMKQGAGPEAVAVNHRGEELYQLYSADSLAVVPAGIPTAKLESEAHREARVGESIKTCQRILSNPDQFLILDIEAANNKVLEFVLVDVAGEVVYESLFKPTGQIDSGSISVHGIRRKDVKDAPRFWNEWPHIQGLMAGKTLLIFSASNDVNFIRNTINDKSWNHDLICVQKLYHQYRDFADQQSLVNACGQSGIQVKDSHRAKVDCLMTLDLIKAMAKGAPLVEDYEHSSRDRKKAPVEDSNFKLGDTMNAELLALREQLFGNQ